MRVSKAKKLIQDYETLVRINRHDDPYKFAEAAKEFFNTHEVDAYYMLANELKVLEGIQEVRKEVRAKAKLEEKSPANLGFSLRYWTLGFY